MTSTFHSGRRRPAILMQEVEHLAARFGKPERWECSLAVDDYIRPYRFGAINDRRAEVVFAIEDLDGGIWVHAKRTYPRNLFRLPSGGVGWDEGVENALMREIVEETALAVDVVRFLGLIRYQFEDAGQTMEFASYVFHLRSRGGAPQPDAGEAITEFRKVKMRQIKRIADDLMLLTGERSAWGKWRSVAHRVVYQTLGDSKK